MKSNYTLKPSDIQRFWIKVNPIPDENGCLNWLGAIRGRMGYGSFRLGNCCMNAHRAAWILTNGDLPRHIFVCHHCDNPKCCNLDHLFLGTNADNMADMVKKGRAKGRAAPKGIRNGAAKLTDEQVSEIRTLWLEGYLSQREIAAMYGIKQPHISDIVTGKKR